MKVIVVGGTGTIGVHVVRTLADIGEVVVASRNSDVSVDITSVQSIRDMYDKVVSFDHLVSVTGSAHWGPFSNMTEDELYIGIRSKLMGQVNLVMEGRNRISDGGSFTLTSGILGDRPVKGSVGLSLVNGALNSFVKAVATEPDTAFRINIVNASLVTDSESKYEGLFPGYSVVKTEEVAQAYRKCIESQSNGLVVELWG
jgi:NAD(P)-dependent dehydrogenase (short-subunit alcohol dehydrogenase family)